MSNKRVSVDEFGAAAKKMYGTHDLTKAEMEAVSATYNISIPSKCKYAEVVSESPIVRRIPVTEEVSAPPELMHSTYPTTEEIAPLTESELSEHREVSAPLTSVVAERTSAATLDSTISFIPKVDKSFVAWGNISDIKRILKSRLFFPVYLTGMSGNGKTYGIEQTCAMLGREMIRVNFTTETDEDDLFGGFRLVNGETVFQYGPVVEAMKRGAVLLLDEIDLGSHKIMALQSVLEGKGYFCV
jgi:hypothetical protein